jgi:transcriptional regulator with XRE-family HTH domain
MTEITSAGGFGKRVREERKRLGLRQEEVALGVGVGLRFLSELENAKPTIELERALRVAQSLGLAVHVDVPEPRHRWPS